MNAVKKVTFEELIFALYFGSSAIISKTHIEDYRTNASTVAEDETGEIDASDQWYDSFSNELYVAINEKFGIDYDYYLSIIYRIKALPILMRDERMKSFIIYDVGNEVGIDKSVFELLAEIPMFFDTEINNDDFFKEIKLYNQ